MEKSKQIESLKSQINVIENDSNWIIGKRIEDEDHLGDLEFILYTLNVLKNSLRRLEMN